MAPGCFLPIRRGPADCPAVPRKGQRKRATGRVLPAHWPRPHQPQQAGPGAACWPPAGGRGPAQCGRGKALSFFCSKRAAAAGAAGGGSPLLLQQRRRRRPRRQNSRGPSPQLQRLPSALAAGKKGDARLASANERGRPLEVISVARQRESRVGRCDGSRPSGGRAEEWREGSPGGSGAA